MRQDRGTQREVGHTVYTDKCFLRGKMDNSHYNQIRTDERQLPVWGRISYPSDSSICSLRRLEQEREYWYQLYPFAVRRAREEVIRACDQLDYEGSLIYDEYPDRLRLECICERILQNMTAICMEKDGCEKISDKPYEEKNARIPAIAERTERSAVGGGTSESGDLIRILLLDEISRRRRYRRRFR